MRFELKDYHRNVSNEELINDVLRVKMIYGKDTLTKAEYKEHGKYSCDTFLSRFGGWSNVLCACGLRVTKLQAAAAKAAHNYAHVTDEQLICDLLRVSKIIGEVSFSSTTYDEHGAWSRDTYSKRFGTWNRALKCAGLQPYKQCSSRKIDNAKILEEIERLWVKLGRQPTATDIRNGESIYSLNTFIRHFGGWRNALIAFIKYVSEKDEQDPVADEQDHPAVTEMPINPSLPESALIVQDVETGDTQKHKTPREPNLRLRFKVLQRDQFRCCSCGASPAKDPGVELHVDHIFPWSKGGETVLENLQTLCSKCNGGKSNLL